MNIGILSSSRADINIYTPLLKSLENEEWINASIILFGDHFLFEGWENIKFKTISLQTIHTKHDELDSKTDSLKIAFFLNKFNEFLQTQSKHWDIIISLGDRYEMFAASLALKLANFEIAHIHGGEITSGSYDNYYRDFITRLSSLHFPSTKEFGKRISCITGSNENIYPVGSLGIEYLNNYRIATQAQEKRDVEKCFIATLHPYINQTKEEINDFFEAILQSGYKGIITYPNSDYGREEIIETIEKIKWPKHVQIIPNLGSKYPEEFLKATLIIGNSSSGIIEAGAFNKWVINVGIRQKGRPFGQNVINLPFNHTLIQNTIIKLMNSPTCQSMNSHPYGDKSASKKIIEVLKKIHHGC